jgi:tetratricopeptide (TPR) repeat protein
VAHNNLAVLFEQRGQLQSAITHFQRTLDIQSSSGQARYDLPLARAHTNLASAFLRKGRIDDAISHCESALKLRPGFAEAETALGDAFLQKRAMREAIVHYEKSLEPGPGSVVALNNLALIFATCPDSQFRNGLRAIQLAKQADALRGGKDPSVVRTLAAAYAENGQFQEAVATAERALKLGKAQGNLPLADDVRIDIDLYKLNLPRREHLNVRSY